MLYWLMSWQQCILWCQWIHEMCHQWPTLKEANEIGQPGVDSSFSSLNPLAKVEAEPVQVFTVVLTNPLHVQCQVWIHLNSETSAVHFFYHVFITLISDNILVNIIEHWIILLIMKITRKMSQMVGMACCMISLWRQEVLQFAILMFQASSTTAHCTMKTDAQAFFTVHSSHSQSDHDKGQHTFRSRCSAQCAVCTVGSPCM